MPVLEPIFEAALAHYLGSIPHADLMLSPGQRIVDRRAAPELERTQGVVDVEKA
jgi:hypothetical protein